MKMSEMSGSTRAADKTRGFLFVGPYPPPYGGISSHLVEITGPLAEAGYRCHTLTFTDDVDSSQSPRPNLTVHRSRIRPTSGALVTALKCTAKLPAIAALFGRLPLPRKFGSGYLRALRIVELVRDFDIGTVSVYGIEEAVVVPFLRRLQPSLQIIYTVFAAPFMKPQYYSRYRDFYAGALRDADRVLASSKYCAGVAKWFGEAIDVGVIYYGVDLQRFNPQREPLLRLRTPGLEGKIVILFLGRMLPEMGVLDVLEIALKVNAQRDDTVFVIAGAKGSCTPTVEAAARDSGGRIMCCVNVPADELPGYYASADIVLAPTADRQACMGLAIKEALATARAVVVTNSGGIPEAITHDQEGLIVELSTEGEPDKKGLVDAVLRLCSDSGLRERFGSQGRKRAEELFSRDDTVKAVLCVLGVEQGPLW